VLNSRLRELREAGIIELLRGKGYSITAEGISLGAIIERLNDWSVRWAAGSRPGRKYLRTSKTATTASRNK
jgi:DNA-binding HxlR family transcriptional regulator